MLHAFADWIQNMPWALWLSSSTWAYPFIQLTHFTGLSLWVGTTFALDLRLLGIGKKTETASQLLDALIVWNWMNGYAQVELESHSAHTACSESNQQRRVAFN